ncbi:MAG: hypothetical protein QOH12_3035 [Solirubrobacteraceae bacterium]|jgi:hypothetical protein|nr:hypothetical protein [Solirubrobacteraceae bacterium]
MTDRRLRVIRRTEESAEADVLAILDAATVRILLPPGNVAWRHQVLAEALVDLLSRVLPRLDIVCDSDVLAATDLPPGPAGLAERLEAVRTHGVSPDSPGDPSLTIGIGSVEGAEMWADGSAWQSYIGTQPSCLVGDDASRIPVGSLAAACRVAAHAFSRVMGTAVPQLRIPASLYSTALGYRFDTRPLDDPDLTFELKLAVAMVGAGSVGGAVAYTFARTPGLRGNLEVIDPQLLEAGNLDRALLATAQRSSAEEAKVDVVEDALAHMPDLVVSPCRATVRVWLAQRPREKPLPLVLCAVDSSAARRAVQDCLPLHVLNAACSPHEVTVSRHVTGNGPCVCCLHMAEALDADRIKARLIATATGFNFEMVVALLVARVPLLPAHIQGIELHRGLPPGALDDFVGSTLEALWGAQLLYGATIAETSGGVVAVAAPWVTALAGVLLAAEALKEGADHQPYRLGPGAVAIKYAENPYASPEFAQLSSPDRWPTSECLCRSPRRARLMSERYALPPGAYDV